MRRLKAWHPASAALAVAAAFCIAAVGCTDPLNYPDDAPPPGPPPLCSEFAMWLSPADLTVLPGGSYTVQVTLSRHPPYMASDHSIDLSLGAPLSQGPVEDLLVDHSFDPDPTQGNSTLTFTVTSDAAASALGETYTFTIHGSGGAFRSCAADFVVTFGSAGNASPTAQIDAPTAGSHFPQGRLVTFTGTGDDPEDGSLGGTSLSWTSDLMSGPIGTGTGFTTNSLVAGTHTITLTATDSEGATGTDEVVIWIDKPASCTGLEPLADAYVRGGSFADTPFGTSPLLLIKGILSLEYARKAYLVFDAPAIPASFGSVSLQLKLNRHTATMPREVSLYGIIDNTDWDPTSLSEGSITWNNAPRNVTTSGIAFQGQGTTAADGVRLLATSTLDNTDPPGTTYSFDITDYARWALGDNQAFSTLAPTGDTDGRITLLLAHSAALPGDGTVLFAREDGDACNRPQLVVQ